jgi:homoserine/homoserine lactone efflux protein
MDLNVWLAFFAACWVIAISPGSGAVLAMTHGLAYGVRHASPTILGLQLGVAVTLLVAGAGVGALLLASATAFTVVKVVGAAYLIWLGWRQWVAPVGDARAGEVVATVSPSQGLPLALPSRRERFLLGFFTNVTNPKGIVFMVAVLPQFIDPQRPLWTQLPVLLVTAVGVDVVVMHGYAFLASRAQRWLASARAKKAQSRVFGGVLMAMGASLFLVKRTAG